MDSPPIDELVARVLAWHNGHRLTRRIAAHHVSGVGVVALPFVPQGERTDRSDWVAGFSEDFIPPLTRQRIVRFARRHASTERPGASDWPQRDVQPDDAMASEPRSVLYLQTACIEMGERRLRVLVAATAPLQVLGPRLWSRLRVAGAAFGLSTIAAVTALAAMPAALPHAATAAVVAPTVPARTVPAAEPPLSSVVDPVAPAATADIEAPPGTPHKTEPLAAPARTDEAPAPVAAGSGADPETTGPSPTGVAADVDRPQIRPMLSSEDRQSALHEGRRLRAIAPPVPASASHRPSPSTVTTTVARPVTAVASAAAVTTAAATATVADAQAYAVMTPVTRSRVASDLRYQLMGSGATVGELPGKPRSELMQVGDGWRVVVWPFATRQQAETARRQLAEQGIRTEVLSF